MYLSDKEIKNGFWYHRRDESFPPKSITFPDQYNGERYLNIVCTQLDISSYQQRKLVKQWCQLIPKFDNLRYLWFSSRVNQAVLEACCENPNIEGLFLKWGSIKDISGLKHMKILKFLHIGSAPSVESIAVFREMTNLTVLDIENFKKIQDISPLGSMIQLEGLAIEGSMWTTQVVESLTPLCDLENLRYIFLANLRTLDKTIKPLSEIKTLMNIRTSFWYPKREFKLLRESLPKLKYGTPFQTDLIDRFGK
jgi:hypothetical protein